MQEKLDQAKLKKFKVGEKVRISDAVSSNLTKMAQNINNKTKEVDRGTQNGGSLSPSPLKSFSNQQAAKAIASPRTLSKRKQCSDTWTNDGGVQRRFLQQAGLSEQATGVAGSGFASMLPPETQQPNQLEQAVHQQFGWQLEDLFPGIAPASTGTDQTADSLARLPPKKLKHNPGSASHNGQSQHGTYKSDQP